MIEHQSSQQIMVVPYFERNLTLLWGWREMSLEIREPSKEHTFCYLRICSFGKNKYLIKPPTYSETVDVYIIYIYSLHMIFQFCYIFCMCVFQFLWGFKAIFHPKKKKNAGKTGTEVQTWSLLRLRRTSATAAPASNPWRRLSKIWIPSYP